MVNIKEIIKEIFLVIIIICLSIVVIHNIITNFIDLFKNFSITFFAFILFSILSIPIGVFIFRRRNQNIDNSLLFGIIVYLVVVIFPGFISYGFFIISGKLSIYTLSSSPANFLLFIGLALIIFSFGMFLKTENRLSDKIKKGYKLFSFIAVSTLVTLFHFSYIHTTWSIKSILSYLFFNIVCVLFVIAAVYYFLDVV